MFPYFPPSTWNIFKANDNLELIHLRDTLGKCNGYLLAVSHSYNNTDYSIHIMKLDENGNKVCEAAPLPDLGSSDYIHEMILDKDGTIVWLGTWTLGLHEIYCL